MVTQHIHSVTFQHSICSCHSFASMKAHIIRTCSNMYSIPLMPPQHRGSLDCCIKGAAKAAAMQSCCKVVHDGLLAGRGHRKQRAPASISMQTLERTSQRQQPDHRRFLQSSTWLVSFVPLELKGHSRVELLRCAKSARTLLIAALTARNPNQLNQVWSASRSCECPPS